MVKIVSDVGDIIEMNIKCKKCGENIVYETTDFIPYCPICGRSYSSQKNAIRCIECGGEMAKYSDSSFRCHECKSVVNIWNINLELSKIKKELRYLEERANVDNGK